MRRRALDRALDVFVWVTLAALLIMGLQVGLDSMDEKPAFVQTVEIAPSGVERPERPVRLGS